MEYQYVSGLFELASDNHEAGFQMLIEALNEAERMDISILLNSILLSLTKAELATLKSSSSKISIDSTGPWMTRLGVHAREKNYPGIRMQHALLKAEYQEMIGEAEAAQLTLQDALTFTDSPGVKTLRNRIQERLQELEAFVDA
jgi:hypothetical protein